MASEPMVRSNSAPAAGTPPASSAPSTSVVLVGAGAIGSAAAGLLAKEPMIDSVVVIDHDVYEPKNRTQDIMPDDVGLPKAVVQARRLRRLNPALQVVPIVDAVERSRMRATGCDVTSWLSEQHLPAGASSSPLSTLGLLAGDVITVGGAEGQRHLQLGLPAWAREPAVSAGCASSPAANAAQGVL